MSKNLKKEKVKGLENAKVFRIKAGTFVNPKKKVLGTGFINVSTYPTKIELDLEILSDYAYDYLPQISYNIGMPISELQDLIINYDSDVIKKRFELINEISLKKSSIEAQINKIKDSQSIDDSHPIIKYHKTISDRLSYLQNGGNINIAKGPIIFRISIPFWRLHENCYCGDIYVSKEDFLKGVLIFNKTFGKFCVNILPEHKFLLEDYYNRFIKMLQQINMDERAFFFACPEEGNRADNIGHFCTVCLSNKVKKTKRKILKEIIYFKENPLKHRLKVNLSRKDLKIKNSKRIKEDI